MGADVGASLVLACGHESAGGRALAGLGLGGELGRSGREVTEAVRAALRRSELPVCVVPMTLGRDATLMADSARALRQVQSERPLGRVVLANPFGTADHLVGWLRASSLRISTTSRSRSAVLVTAPPAGPFNDAELFRVARLVHQYGRHEWVEVAFDGGDPSIDEGVERCLRLGAERVTAIPASFGLGVPTPLRAEAAAQVGEGGPLLTPAAARAVTSARVGRALHLLRLGDNGIRGALDAEHGHGYAHTHTHPVSYSH